jgi:hypothetical protein
MMPVADTERGKKTPGKQLLRGNRFRAGQPRTHPKSDFGQIAGFAKVELMELGRG